MPFTLQIKADHNPENVAPVNEDWEEEVIIGRGEASGFRLPDPTRSTLPLRA